MAFKSQLARLTKNLSDLKSEHITTSEQMILGCRSVSGVVLINSENHKKMTFAIYLFFYYKSISYMYFVEEN